MTEENLLPAFVTQILSRTVTDIDHSLNQALANISAATLLANANKGRVQCRPWALFLTKTMRSFLLPIYSSPQPKEWHRQLPLRLPERSKRWLRLGAPARDRVRRDGQGHQQRGRAYSQGSELATQSSHGFQSCQGMALSPTSVRTTLLFALAIHRSPGGRRRQSLPCASGPS